MTSIHLIRLDSQTKQTAWPFGKVWRTPASLTALGSLLEKQANQVDKDDFWLFWGNPANLPAAALMETLVAQPVDLWHAGLLLGMGGLPELIDFVAPTWRFNRDPDPAIEAASWRVSLQACLVRGEVIRQLGFLNLAFENLAAATLEWGHRCLRQGALLRHHPSLLPANFQALPQVVIPFHEQLRFIHLRYGRKWAAWAALRAMLSGSVPLRHGLAAWRQLRSETVPSKAPIYAAPIACRGSAQDANPPGQRVSVLIPTLERYPYLRTLLRQLGAQSCPADEIVVVDQTPSELREPQFYQAFERLPLRVFYQEQAGQCSSRNLGLQAAQGDYILLLDDDIEIPPDLIEKHLQHLESSAADASCGAADEAGSGPLPAAFTYRRASDVFPAGNSLVRRTALLKSGLFDLAYEHGARADSDLGMRLYLSGAHLILEPAIRVLHHHAPRGGLRTHKARKATYASSRSSLLQRRLPEVTELYLIRRYFHSRQVREQAWLSLLGTFSLHQPGPRRWLKIVLSGLLLPHSLWVLWRRSQIAIGMLAKFPQIPRLEIEKDRR